MRGGSHALSPEPGGAMMQSSRDSARLGVMRDTDAMADHAPVPLDVIAEPMQLDALYRRYAGYVAAVAVRLLGRDGEIDDLVQDVFVEAVRGVAKVRDPNAIKGWLAKVAVRMCVRRLQKRSLFRALHLQL